jgi:hypothetical protein
VRRSETTSYHNELSVICQSTELRARLILKRLMLTGAPLRGSANIDRATGSSEVASSVAVHWPTRHGENSGQVFIAAVAQAFVLSLWQTMHGFGTFNDSDIDGLMNLKVWLRTITSPIVCSIGGIWQLTHSLPGEPA